MRAVRTLACLVSFLAIAISSQAIGWLRYYRIPNGQSYTFASVTRWGQQDEGSARRWNLTWTQQSGFSLSGAGYIYEGSEQAAGIPTSTYTQYIFIKYKNGWPWTQDSSYSNLSICQYDSNNGSTHHFVGPPAQGTTWRLIGVFWAETNPNAFSTWTEMEGSGAVPKEFTADVQTGVVSAVY